MRLSDNERKDAEYEIPDLELMNRSKVTMRCITESEQGQG